MSARELDAWLAEHLFGVDVNGPCCDRGGGNHTVLGHIGYPPRGGESYCSTYEGMGVVLEAMQARGFWGDIEWPSGDDWRVSMRLFRVGTSVAVVDIPFATSPSLPMAVALAAKAAVESEGSR